MTVADVADQIRQIPKLIPDYDPAEAFVIFRGRFKDPATGREGSGGTRHGFVYLIGKIVNSAYAAGVFVSPQFDALRKRIKPCCELKVEPQAAIGFIDWLYDDCEQDIGGIGREPFDRLANALLAVAQVAADPKTYIPHRTAFPMLGIEVDSKQASKIISRIRGKAGDALKCEKRGNQWWYDPQGWASIVEIIRAAGSVSRYVDDPAEIEERISKERETKRRTMAG